MEPSTRIFTIDESVIKIQENSVYHPGHGSIIWAASFVMADWILVEMKSSFAGKKLLELGGMSPFFLPLINSFLDVACSLTSFMSP